MSSESHDVVDRTQWHDLLRSFSDVKTLRVGLGLVEEFSRSLQLDDGKSPVELLPELKVLLHPDLLNTPPFTEFVDARRIAGHPVTLRPFGDPVPDLVPDLFPVPVPVPDRSPRHSHS